MDADRTAAESSAEVRRRVLHLLNEALSGEYHSFVGHALGSNPYVPPGCEKDLEVLERIRDEENDNARAFLLQLARYRAGPTLKAFRWWRHDLNFLGLDFLVIRAAEVVKDEAARIEAIGKDLPDDPELRATFQSVVATKRRHAAELTKLAGTRQKERDARRKAALAVTAIPLKKGAAAAPAPKPAGTAPAAGAPPLPGAPKAPPLPGAPKAPPLPGAPKPPSPPLPPGAKAPSPPRPPSPPLPPGAKPPGPPKPPAPPAAAPAAEPPTADAPAAPAAPAPADKPKHPPLPPGFKLPPKRG